MCVDLVPCPRSCHFYRLRVLLEAVVRAQGHLVVAGAAAAGRDDDDAVGRLRAVLRGRGGVLQHLDRGDVVGVEVRVLPHVEPVHDVQRLGGAEEVLAADDDARRLARLAAGGDLHARDAAAQRLLYGGDLPVLDRLARHARDGAGDVAPLLVRVADGDDGVEGQRLRLQGEGRVGRLAGDDGDALRGRRVADARGAELHGPGADAG